jgi:hypothetical protein
MTKLEEEIIADISNYAIKEAKALRQNGNIGPMATDVFAAWAWIVVDMALGRFGGKDGPEILQALERYLRNSGDLDASSPLQVAMDKRFAPARPVPPPPAPWGREVEAVAFGGNSGRPSALAGGGNEILAAMVQNALPIVVQRLQADGLTPSDVRNRVEALIADKRSPEGMAATKRQAEEFEAGWRAKEQARVDAKLRLKDEWQIAHAYRWMLEPVPYFDEDTQSTAWMPMAESVAEVEAIRACAREWEHGDRSQKLHRHLFDNLAHFNMDFESLVAREDRLYLEAVEGIPFLDKDEPFGLY